MCGGWLSFTCAVAYNMALAGSAGPDIVSLCISIGVTIANYVVGLATGYSQWKATKICGCAISAYGCYVFSW